MRTLTLQRLSRSIQSRQWTCARCQTQQISRYNSSISSNAAQPQSIEEDAPPASLTTENLNNKNSGATKKPRLQSSRNIGNYFVTTPIFYVNGDPHVGHMHSMVVADVIKRYKELQGKAAILSTGTDEHGMKVQKAAFAAGTDPLEFCTASAQKFKDLAQQMNMSEHVFIRTTQPEHKAAVQHFWKRLLEKGYIYKGTHEGWYSVTDECFYKPTQITDSQSPTKTPLKISKETGSIVEWTSEENYCFKLSAFRDQLRQHYEKHSRVIVPKTYYNDVMNALQEPLEDISISRPRSRLSWGIEVPGDEEQTIYVWFDALVNYLTVTGYPSPDLFSEQNNIVEVDEGAVSQEDLNLADPSEPGLPISVKTTAWPADVHVIGKDIVRFHCIFWPAFLLAAKLTPPRQILVHGHWTLNGLKMSKSLGNVISPTDVLSAYHPDVIRYYMIKEGGQEGDGNWNFDSLRNRYTYLCNTWGNLLSRALTPKLGGTGARLKGAGEKEEKEVEMSPAQYEEERKLRNAIDSAVEVYKYMMNQLNLEGALSVIDNLFRVGNVYMTNAKPWLYKTGHERKRLHVIMFRIGEVLRIGAIMAQPFMPIKAGEMLDALNVKPDRRGMKDAEWRGDIGYGVVKPSGKGKPVHVFPRLEEPEGEAAKSIEESSPKAEKQ